MSSTFTSPIKYSSSPSPATFTRASSLELINLPLRLSPDGSPQKLLTKSNPESSSDMRMTINDSGRRECFIDYLPNEILFMVFSYLGVTGICRSGQVCQRWREISQDEVLWKKRYERLWVLSDFESVRSKYRYRLTTTEFNSNTWFQRYGVLFKSTFIWKASARIIIEDNHDEGLNHVIRHRNLQQHIQSLHQQQQQQQQPQQQHNNNNNSNQQQRQQIIQNQAPDAQEIDELDAPQIAAVTSQDVTTLNPQPQSNPNPNSNSLSINNLEISQSHEHTFSSPPPHPSSSSSSSGLQLNIPSTSRSPRNRSVDVRFEAQRIDNPKHERIVEELDMDMLNEADF